jgi:hypothetical protein
MPNDTAWIIIGVFNLSEKRVNSLRLDYSKLTYKGFLVAKAIIVTPRPDM